MLTMGSMGETASVAVDEMRKAGKKVGLVKLRLWRPFPVDELRAAIQGCKTLIVMDRALSIGGAGGPVATESNRSCTMKRKSPGSSIFIVGLGGRDVTVEDFMAMFEMAKKKKDETYEYIWSEGIMNPVQNFEIYAPKLVDKKEYLSAGHRACQGCGEVLALRHISRHWETTPSWPMPQAAWRSSPRCYPHHGLEGALYPCGL